MFLLTTIGVLFLSTFSIAEIDRLPIQGFHFHAYYFQNNEDQLEKIKRFHDVIHHETEDANGALPNCALGQLWLHPVGPHTMGMFQTCCNATDISRAVSFFMKNHGDFPVLFHALTESEKKDHTERAFWLGASIPLDVAHMGNGHPEDAHNAHYCPTRYDTWNHTDFYPRK